ncbi:PREDICTED: coiled-coil domain-containing protein 62 isoform X2 [Poecilia mexicana]|uniref:coiled-coil domain-containing protein 62 isoform X2 n=1 Tax=Poecilia mexicana TaxID=48701 RepID=UPI00072EA46E|nr:PREDICTED: coiled-coil domain-containing protein 62 isoform X2 [Poecilia mexicana]
MDGRRKLFTSGHSSFLRADDGSATLWHSTPVKEKGSGSPLDGKQPCGPDRGSPTQWVQSSAGVPTDSCCGHNVQGAEELPVKDLSSSTIQRQRRELQLLMAELKDRERELNAMSASHQRQHQAWEQDRQTALVLERRCSRLDDELQRSNEVISVLTKHVWVVESREKEAQTQLGDAKQLLCELEKQQQQVSQKCQDYEAKNQSLSSAVMALSTQVGSLQVREEELSSMLKLKDKDVVEASGRNLELSARLQDLETSLAESRSQENKLLRDLEETKRRYREAKHEVSQLRAELQQQVSQSSRQREEIIRLKQELQLLHTDLALTGEGESWKDELLELSRSKQERIMSELLCLQQVCENQRSDLQLLRLNQESTQRAQRETHHQRLPSRQDESACNYADIQSLKNLRPDHEASPVAGVHDSDTKPEGFPANMTDVADQLSACSLQQPLGISRLLPGAPESSSSLRCHASTGCNSNCETAQPHTAHHHLNTTIPKVQRGRGNLDGVKAPLSLGV